MPEPVLPGDGWRDWLSRHLRLDTEAKLDVYVSIASSATLRDATYWAEILFSAGIATLGLTLGSPAVIIGAMLISPLMAPIMAAGLALAAGDFILATRAAASIVLSCVSAVALSTFLVVLLPFREMTAEIASRTHPNTLDLVIALFSGAVGALAVCKSVRGVATSIPGVAIAVALMPPLCVTGYGIGVMVTVDRSEGLAVLTGGALLFFTNLVAITFSSMIVFLLLHIDSDSARAKIRQWRESDLESTRLQTAIDRVVPGDLRRMGGLPARLFLIILLLVSVSMPLKRSFDTLASEIRQRQHLNRAHKIATDEWERLFERGKAGEARSYIDRLDVSERGNHIQVNVRAFVSENVRPNERTEYVRRLAADFKRPATSIDLSLIEIPTSQYRVAEKKSEAPATVAEPPETLGARLMEVSREAESAVRATNLPPTTVFEDAAVVLSSRGPQVVLSYLSPVELSEDARLILEANLRQQLDLTALSLRLRWIPAQLQLSFGRGAELSAADRERLTSLVQLVRETTDLRVTLHASSLDRRSDARLAAVRQMLAEGGLDVATILTQKSDMKNDQVVVNIERAAPVAPR